MRLRFLTAVVLALASPAIAVAPCPDSCHLGQGQPLLLADIGALLVTHCDMTWAADHKSVTTYACTTEQLDRNGAVIKTLPRAPSGVGSDAEFTKAHLDGHAVVRLEPQVAPFAEHAWSFALHDGQRATLSLAKSTLTCATPGRPDVTRDVGCVPASVLILATSGSSKPPFRPVVALATCKPDAVTEHEVVVTCEASEP